MGRSKNLKKKNKFRLQTKGIIKIITIIMWITNKKFNKKIIIDNNKQTFKINNIINKNLNWLKRKNKVWLENLKIIKTEINFLFKIEK